MPTEMDTCNMFLNLMVCADIGVQSSSDHTSSVVCMENTNMLLGVTSEA